MMATGIWIVVMSVALARAKTEPAYAVAVGTPQKLLTGRSS